MGPIASKLLADLRRKSRRSIIDLTQIRQARQDAARVLTLADASDEDGKLNDKDVPPGFTYWMDVTRTLAAFAFPLLGSRRLRKLAERLEESEERYAPGGPPMSPLTDSFHTFWGLADTAVGLKKESLASIAIAVAQAHHAPAALLEEWTTMANSYPGIYRVLARRGADASLKELMTGQTFEVTLADNAAGRAGDLWWTRLLPPPQGQRDWVSIVTPYVMRGPGAERAWREYFDRVLQDSPAGKRVEAYRRLMKQGKSPYFWFEYILDGYVGELNCAIELTGVPDSPDSLPHSEQNEHSDLEGDAEVNPLERLRRRLQTIALDHGLGQRAFDAFRSAREELAKLTGDVGEWAIYEQQLLTGYAMFSARTDDGKTALDLLERSELPADEQAAMDASNAGWFSVFEVVRIKIGSGIELRDVLRRRRFWIVERTATRQVAIGDLLACWVMHQDDSWYLEGAVARVPEMWAPGLVATVRDLMDVLRKGQRTLTWKVRHDQLPPMVNAMIARLYNNPPIPRLQNHDGHPLLLSEAIYELRDRTAVLTSLAAAPELGTETTDDEFVWIDEDKQVVTARITVGSDTLSLSTNSRERHDRARAWLEERLGQGIAHRADTFSDPTSDALEKGPLSRGPEPQLPADVQAAMIATLEHRLHSWLDEAIPALGGKTPRQAVRSERGRDDVGAMLLQQERTFRRSPGADKLDFASLWSEIGLPYLGPPL